MHIGILGAAFNPPHLGHLLMARQTLDFTDIEKVWFLPVFKHTFDKKLLDSKHRFAMTRLMQMPQTEVSTLEIDHKLDGNTINLVPLLKKLYPNDSFTFIIGSDNLPTFHKWGSWQELLKQMPFLVIPRSGYPLKPLYEGMQVLHNPLFITTNISSSLVRSRIKAKLSIDHLVVKEVAEYIKSHNLYGEQNYNN